MKVYVIQKCDVESSEIIIATADLLSAASAWDATPILAGESLVFSAWDDKGCEKKLATKSVVYSVKGGEILDRLMESELVGKLL